MGMGVGEVLGLSEFGGGAWVEVWWEVLEVRTLLVGLRVVLSR